PEAIADPEVDPRRILAPEKLAEARLVIAREESDRSEITAVGAQGPLFLLEVGEGNAGVVLDKTLRPREEIVADVGKGAAVQEV
ncbi:MAG: hypothetical protein ABL886_05835, partial [Rhodoglobus sp.]